MSKSTLTVATRMYKVKELGDCFLLRFTNGEEQAKQKCNVLIDCGSFRNSAASKQRMKQVVANIQEELGNEPLHLVVGTHQHNDHLSGFVHAAKEFESITIEQVWLSWLDNPKDKLATALRREQQKALDKLDLMGRILHKGFKKSSAAEKVSDVLGFSLNIERRAAGEPAVPAEGIQFLKSAGAAAPRYVEPGQTLDLPNLKNVARAYVLGPPKDRKLIRDITASGEESYDHRLAAATAQAETIVSGFSNYVTRLSDNETVDNWEENHFPFTDFYKIKDDVFATTDKSKVWDAYNDLTQSWRKIDEDWLEEAGNLALYMDSYTNNTSLVLAFELVDSGKFLLFVGDAQTGNWISWKNIAWKTARKNFSIEQLLGNTILYKVGHHCSHNATLKKGGLEIMDHEDLVAMIPVDVSDPNITKENGWKMPAKNLYKKLKEKTNHRVIRMDNSFGENCQPIEQHGRMQWSSLSHDHDIIDNDLFIEYTMRFP